MLSFSRARRSVVARARREGATLTEAWWGRDADLPRKQAVALTIVSYTSPLAQPRDEGGPRCCAPHKTRSPTPSYSRLIRSGLREAGDLSGSSAGPCYIGSITS